MPLGPQCTTFDAQRPCGNSSMQQHSNTAAVSTCNSSSSLSSWSGNHYMLQRTMLHHWPATVTAAVTPPLAVVAFSMTVVTCSHKTMCSNSRCSSSSNKGKLWQQSMLQQISTAHQQPHAAFPIKIRAAAAATQCCNRHVQPSATCVNSRQ